MKLGNRINITQRAGSDGWDSVEIKAGSRRLNCTYQIKQQITIKLGTPYNDTITIETNEPISDRGDIEQFAREILSAAELRHESNRKHTIARYSEEFRSAILPLWFEREAHKARYRAEEKDMRKRAKRDLNAGKIDLKSYNDFIRALNSGVKDDDYIDDANDYNSRLQCELCKISTSNDFHFSYRDIEQIMGRKMWEKSLLTREYRTEECKANMLAILARNIEGFNLLYNLESQHISIKYLREEYDTIATIGFGDVILAATLHKEGKLCAVMALDDNQGRRALCHAVGEEQLGKILPKRAYNAVIREGDISLEAVARTYNYDRETIIIE